MNRDVASPTGIGKYDFDKLFWSGKMMLIRIVENNKIDDYFGQVRLSKG